MNSFLRVVLILIVASGVVAAGPTTAPSVPIVLDKTEVGNLPETATSVNGVFAVQVVEGRRVIELPGEPLDAMGLLVGPDKGCVGIVARIQASATGKRYPEFGVGLGGTGGYKLWLLPGQKLLQIIKGDEVVASIPQPFAWTSGTWTGFRMQVQKLADGGTRIVGKVWRKARRSRRTGLISWQEKEAVSDGRAGVWANPYSGTPVRFSDLALEQ